MLANPLIILGGAEGDRTPDPKTASLVLSQLSYSPAKFRDEIANLASHLLIVKKKDRFFNGPSTKYRGHMNVRASG
jgi:hypothetical protein